MWIPLIIAVLLIAGVGVHKYTHEVDSPLEQIVEAGLKAEGVTIDFSADEKEQAAIHKEQAKEIE